MVPFPTCSCAPLAPADTCSPNELSGYYLQFNGRLGRLVMDHELALRGLSDATEVAAGNGHRHGEGQDSGYPAARVVGSVADLEAVQGAGGEDEAQQQQQQQQPRKQEKPQQQQQRVQRILMGHSLGGACAALEYISDPHAYAAIVLVAPAILAGGVLGGPSKSSSSSSNVPRLEQLEDGSLFSSSSKAAGDYNCPEDAAAASSESVQNNMCADSPTSSSASSCNSISSTSTRLDTLDAEPSNPLRSSSSNNNADALRSGVNNSSSSSSGSKRTDTLDKALARGDVALYAAQGDAASFAALLPGALTNQPRGVVATLAARAAMLMRTAASLAAMALLFLLRPAIVLVLRGLVRSRSFWANTLQQAYYDKEKARSNAFGQGRLHAFVHGAHACCDCTRPATVTPCVPIALHCR
jgi:hypothetical protein